MYSKSILKPGNARFLLFRLKRLCMRTAHLAFGLAANGRAPSVLVKVLDTDPGRTSTQVGKMAGWASRPPAVRSTPSDAIRRTCSSLLPCRWAHGGCPGGRRRSQPPARRCGK